MESAHLIATGKKVRWQDDKGSVEVKSESSRIEIACGAVVQVLHGAEVFAEGVKKSSIGDAIKARDLHLGFRIFFGLRPSDLGISTSCPLI